MKRERVVVAMSGGVDAPSRRALRGGWPRVIGISGWRARAATLLAGNFTTRLVAEGLGFPHYVFDESEPFRAT
jgi:tRNA U34 2-thiouridine synthase MnmA/TrmU